MTDVWKIRKETAIAPLVLTGLTIGLQEMNCHSGAATCLNSNDEIK